LDGWLPIGSLTASALVLATAGLGAANESAMDHKAKDADRPVARTRPSRR